MTWKIFKVEKSSHIATVTINRPEKSNALPREGWHELKEIFNDLDRDTGTRVIILCGEGKHFSAGIDLELLMSVQQFNSISCEGRKREAILHFIRELQGTVNAIEECSKPVLAAVHGGCIGGALDIVCACDMRFATTEAYFTVKEIDMGMVADLGTLQRLPKLLPYAIAAELAMTGRKYTGAEAEKHGFVNRVYRDRDELIASIRDIAGQIASKSPLSIRGTKQVLLHSRDHSVRDGLDFIASWNAGMFLSSDLLEAFQATLEKRKPEFRD